MVAHMSRASFFPAALAIGLLFAGTPAAAQDPGYPAGSAEQNFYTAKQLDNLISPVALYPDALLAQVLVASTFPDQVEDAAAFVRANGTSGIDDQAWDVSVKAIAHYPSVLNMMADRADWMTTLGRAYAFQSSDVMLATQRMRALADSHGNLVSNEQQQVVREADNYIIVPAQPRVIYVPVYDPFIVYTRPIFGFAISSRYWSFGVGFPIGGWLNYDLDWGRRVVYYNGWNRSYFGYAGGWRARSYPHIHITNVYINTRYRNVYVNRNVDRRPVNYRNVDRYPRVHGDVYFAEVRDSERRNRDAVARAERSRDVNRAIENAQLGRAERSRDMQRAIGNSDARSAASNAEVGRATRSASSRDAIQRASGSAAGVIGRREVSVPDARRSEPAVQSPDRRAEVQSVQRRQATPQRSSAPQVEQSAPERVRQSAPARVERSAPARVERPAPAQVRQSAPARVERSAPARVERSAPAQVRQSAPAQVRQSAPAQVRQSSPPQSRGGGSASPGKVTRRP